MAEKTNIYGMYYRAFETMRRCFFWLLDFLTGNMVRKDIIDLSQLVNPKLDCDYNDRHEKLINSLLNHASKTTEFYSNYNSLSLTGFPVINKSIIRENIGSFISSDYKKDKLISVVTSGSTGTPFQVFHDARKRKRNSADTIFFARQAGYDIGHKLFYLKIWAKQKMKSNIYYFFQNVVPIDVIKLNNEQISSIIRNILKTKGSVGLIGYSSALELLCRYLDENDCRKIVNVKSVISISESLNDYTRENLGKHFGVVVLSRYSNLENGIIAQQTKDSSGRYLVNMASYHIEVLKMDNDEPALEGELGRIVVTDLYNYGMPMIRYDTGDIGSLMIVDSARNIVYLNEIEGRKLDLLYDTKGNLVSSFIVYKNMWQYTEIEQYQLIQETKTEYRIKINAKTGFLREQQLINEFKDYLGTDAIISIEYVSEIPLLSSGKRKKIINNYIRS